jgi:putative ABC transport system permease protein
VRGRGFTHEDRLGSEDLTIIDEVLARRLFPNEDPVGKRIQTGRSGPWRTIVGVARPAKNAGLVQPDDPEYYDLWRVRSGLPIRRAHLLLRSDAESAEFGSFVRAEVGRVDPTVPVTITTMEGNLARLTERPRMQTWLLTGFAATGLLLAAVGQFGLVSYLVTQRTAEIGIRIALGATPADVMRVIARRVVGWTVTGAVVGLLASMWLARFVQPLLFGVEPGDARTGVVVLVLLGVVSVVAALQPALRAMHVQPALALRHE